MQGQVDIPNLDFWPLKIFSNSIESFHFCNKKLHLLSPSWNAVICAALSTYRKDWKLNYLPTTQHGWVKFIQYNILNSVPGIRTISWIHEIFWKGSCPLSRNTRFHKSYIPLCPKSGEKLIFLRCSSALLPPSFYCQKVQDIFFGYWHMYIVG